jgi:hypothetical protein
MEEALVTQLEDVWDGKTISDKTNIVKGLVEIEKKLLLVSFTRFVFRGRKWYHRLALIAN